MRLENWPEILRAEINRARNMRFAWGDHDCCSWSFRVAREITGVDLWASRRGNYDSEFGAARILAEYGGIELLARSLLGEPCGPLYAQRGDIVLADYEGDSTLGISVGNAVAFVGRVIQPAGDLPGLIFMEPHAARLAWHV
jgi:hypothetical protein